MGMSSKDGRTVFRRYGRAPAGECASQTMPLDRGVRYSILLSLAGYIALHVIEGSIDGEEFYDWVVNDLSTTLCTEIRRNYKRLRFRRLH
ncbi:hypothetical protein AcV5_005999 [Taiwanofungus camphoratus]|nr:hypothetical protein AcV5_005999 [Antrodia cinnamomea]